MKIYIEKGDKRYGPHSQAKVKELLAQGVISTSDSAFFEGTARKAITVGEAIDQWLAQGKVRFEKGPTISTTKQKGPSEEPPIIQDVVVVGFDMPFLELVSFLIKLFFANLVAGLVIGLILALPFLLLLGAVGVLN